MKNLLCLVGLFTAVAAGSDGEVMDVNDVLFRGDSTVFGMKVEDVYTTDGAFLVVTTGARYEYTPGELKVYQGLSDDRRLLAAMSFDQKDNFTKVEQTKDHVLFWSKRFNIGIYGDSTCILAPRQNMSMNCAGDFKPDYEGRYKGELLLIDEGGGMEIYPQRYEAGYEIKRIEPGKVEWVADYNLNAGQRVMIAAFPGRPFDWEKSFKCNILATCGSMGLGKNNPYGQMPPNITVHSWSKNFHIITMFFNGFYENAVINGVENPAGPYIIANKPEFRRFVDAAHNFGMKVTVYCSFFEYFKDPRDPDAFFNQIDKIRQEFNIDGVYIDGLKFGKEDDKIANWEIVRRLRVLFGAEGEIVLHATHMGQLTATSPNIETYCDAVLDGEEIEFNSLDDSYIRYHVRKYGISNTVALWKIGKHPKSITNKDMTDKLIEMNGRQRWGAFVVTQTPPPDWPPHNGKYFWESTLNDEYLYYLEKLKISEQNYKRTSTGINK